MTVLLQLLIIAYGEIEGRRRSEADRLAQRSRQVDAALAERRTTARHRTGEPVNALRARYDADTQLYHPAPTDKTA
ncbi:hypothetical protein [Actinophytocola glycyrrhizae]|uniref:Uncharacterized protein n=1 Tax=Actinophytocola glycyrrhizae TaxID=2044873 RepID=A0ABV9SDC8_9PSEU